MSQLNISDVAREVGLRPSAIRYYEKIGLLPPAERMSKQRRYDAATLYRLAIIQRARQLGFTLDEIRQLFFGFGTVARASERWQQLCRRKLAELDDLMESVKEVQRLLKKVMQNCRCETLDQCGKGIFRSASGNFPVKRLPASRRPAR
jgi:MerR family redox-sensitive transcriptional activator SoxR